ncbi:hypothetical protein JTE90_010447 [Oedothorax gibbosus]|uniref:Uncharacterized protein n=1 Tax=Oedothorax gibbosus TaxID=931172 RepID=A0AAV6W3W2_9ARAC|nr:hypothetical protein JTE90_010447 [Oedothorax gibbosus]
MWKVCFLLAWLAHAARGQSSEDLKEFTLMTDLDAEFDKIAEEYISSLTLAHTKTPSRNKRDLSSDIETVVDDSGVYRLQSINAVSQLCQTAVYSKFVDVGNETYAICAKAETLHTPAEVIVGLYKEHQWKPEFRWFIRNAYNFEAFHFKEYMYVLVAEEGKEGTDLVRINLSTKEVVVDHTVHSKYPARISTWTMKVDGKFHMAVANLPRQDSTDYVSDVYFYMWFGTYFDRYSSVQAYDVKDIEPFHIHGAAYLAIANFRKSKNDYNVDSEILKYDLDEKRWLSHQRIRTYGAMDWEFFTIGSTIKREFYLVVANNQDNGEQRVKTTVFKFIKDKFIPFQCLPTERGTSIASWSDDRIFLLAVANTDAVYLYQYDGWQFVLSDVQYTQGAMSSGVQHLVFHSVANMTANNLMLSVSNPYTWQDPSIFELGFYYENYLRSWNEESTAWCLNTFNRLESTDAGSVMSLLDDVVFVDQTSPITINGSIHFESGFGTDKLQTPFLKEIITQETYDGRMLLNLEELHRRLQEVSVTIAGFEEVLKNALKIEGNQTVYGNLEFQDVSFDCEAQSCRFDSIQTTILNGEEIGDWSKNLVFLDSDQVVNGTILAEKVIANEINVQGLIDGVDSRTLVTKSGNHTITGRKTFVNLVEAKDVEVHGLVDGVDISPTNVLLTTGHQTITGNINFMDVETTWLEAGFVNAMNLTSFYEDVVRSDQPATIGGTTSFHDLTVDDLYMNTGATINGVDLADLWANALRIEGDQIITAPFTFQSVSMHKNLEAVKGINGIEIPGPRVMSIYDNFTSVTAPHVFTSSTKINQLNVLKSLNGLAAFEIPGRLPELDIMLKTGDQVIRGKKTFSVIHLDENSFVQGTVDGVDLSEFKNIALRRDTKANANRTWTFNNLVIKGPLTVNKISGYDINDIYERAVKLTDEHLPNIIFKDLVKIEELESHNINGIDIERDLVLKNKPQTLTGKKTFNHITLEDNIIVLGTVNNLNMSFLQETILRIGNQNIKSKVFNGNVKMNKLTITGSINNVPISDLVTLSGDESILNSRELVNVTFNEIHANKLQVTGTVNGIDVDRMMEDTMTYTGKERVKGMKTVKGTIHIVDGEHVTAHNINGININEIWDDAVLLDVPQDISGRKVFKAPVSFENLDFKDTIDGVSESDMNNWMLKDAPQVVTSNVYFSNGLAVGHLDVEGTINGIDIVELDRSLVKTNEPATIVGPVVFHDHVISTGDISLSGKIQGVDLSEEAVTHSGEKVVNGVKTFAQDLIVSGDATVGGLVDGISIQDLCEKTLLVHKDQNIRHMTIKGDVTFLGGGTIEGKIADIDLEELHRMAVSTADSEMAFSGVKTFRNLTIEGLVIIEGKLGGVDLHLLNQTYMSLTRDQDITARIDFEDLSFEGTLAAKRLNVTSRVLNGIDIGVLNRIMRTDISQTITAEHYFDEIIFASDVFVVGKVNGLDVPESLMRHNHVNYVQSPKLFEKPVRIFGDLIMAERARVQGVDVSEWYKKSVLKEGSFEIDGYKTFINLSITDAKVGGYLDGLRISEDSLLMTYGDQVITGRKTIKGNVEIQKSLIVDGLINGVNLTYLSTQTLQRDRSNSITGVKEFTQPLSIYNLEAPTVAGVDITALEKKIHKQVDFGKLQSRLNEIGEVISIMQDAVNKQAVIFQYYDLFQEFEIPTAYNWQYVSGEDCGELLLLSDNSSSLAHCSSVRLFKFDVELKKFVAHPQELTASNAVSVKSLVIYNVTYLFVANQNPNRNPECLSGKNVGGGNTTGDIYMWNGNVFESYQTLEVPPILSMVVFQHQGMSCIVYVEINYCEVYCSVGRGLEFTLREILPTRGGRKASIIHTPERILLALVAEDLVPRVDNVGDKRPVDIYLWHPEESTFGHPMQVILSTYAQSAMLMYYKTEHSSYTFLVVAEGRIPKVQNEPKIIIYRFDESNNVFHKYQEIRDYGDVEWIVLRTGELVLFALDSYLGKINLYQHKGASGFVLVDTVNSIGSISVHPFIRKDIRDSINHYLALAGPRAAMIPSQGIDYAKILKSKVKGNNLFLVALELSWIRKCFNIAYALGDLLGVDLVNLQSAGSEIEVPLHVSRTLYRELEDEALETIFEQMKIKLKNSRSAKVVNYDYGISSDTHWKAQRILKSVLGSVVFFIHHAYLPDLVNPLINQRKHCSQIPTPERSQILDLPDFQILDLEELNWKSLTTEQKLVTPRLGERG